MDGAVKGDELAWPAPGEHLWNSGAVKPTLLSSSICCGMIRTSGRDDRHTYYCMIVVVWSAYIESVLPSVETGLRGRREGKPWDSR